MRIYAHGIPLDTNWFFPYCCSTVDMAFDTPRDYRSRTLIPIFSTNL
jgi:hypothetical protein